MGKDPIEERKRSKSRGLRRKRSGTADWASVDPAALVNAICCAAAIGGALRFGYSRDGGAYAIGIYGDGDPYTEWVKPDEDLTEVLEMIAELFQNLADDQASPATSKEASKEPKKPAR